MSSFLVWREEGHKYNCSTSEAFMMVLITAITNFACMPALCLLYKKNLVFETYVGVFTFVTSFMYHFVESIGAEKLFMKELEWHQLDNIGAIMCFITVFIHMANFQNYNLQMQLNYSAMFIVIILQVADPWNLTFTVAPIVIYALIIIALAIYLKTQPFTNRQMTIKGFSLIFLGAIFFSLSQDEHTDYLRIYHGLWHSVIGLSAIYTWQSHEKEGEEVYITTVFTTKIKYQSIQYESNKHI
ncbi:transmembrane protein, putative (macronuclear) [Tetrahymena thermophila SB210]|uniref:Transmembrane protein, putative n=1 Tax=Tetrahymena thermophila (strain SB210) TaxID=312017 RepID=I7M4N5_TETTS|nr:transmembrane protein, putative [Tetrahymena thermophila SB210]EAS07733.2 transmembrane protein, putative [Tetrahymena thermophila SB210]|eukprot:XP_001027975.2 transmembrane protein, putative [Tetrahymena thermophila SB210]